MFGSALAMRALSVSRNIVLNAYWIPLNFQNAALLTIAVPAALLRFRGIDYVSELALLASLVAVISMIVPPAPVDNPDWGGHQRGRITMDDRGADAERIRPGGDRRNAGTERQRGGVFGSHTGDRSA
jgi:hypothetical protein